MNARNFFAELKRRNVSESRANDLAGGTKQRPPDRLGVVRCGKWIGFSEDDAGAGASRVADQRARGRAVCH